MSNSAPHLQDIADRVEIAALCAEFTDAGMMHDLDRLAGTFTDDGVWRIPEANIEHVGRTQIRTNVERMREFWEYFVQNAHQGSVELTGDTATGRTYIVEFGRLADGTSHLNYAIYHDSYRRTDDGWKFAARTYEMVYVDSTELTGSPAGSAVRTAGAVGTG